MREHRFYLTKNLSEKSNGRVIMAVWPNDIGSNHPNLEGPLSEESVLVEIDDNGLRNYSLRATS
jgi:hypothetical protein